MFKISVHDKCCLRVPSNRKGYDGTVHAKEEEIYLNERTLRNSGLLKLFSLSRIKDNPIHTLDGVLYPYICPRCGKVVYMRKDESHTPYKSCDACYSKEFSYMYYENKGLVKAWVDLIAQNYDPLEEGTATVNYGVIQEWKDPINFISDIRKEFDVNALKLKSKMALTPLCLYLKRGNVWCIKNVALDVEGEKNEDKKKVIFNP